VCASGERSGDRAESDAVPPRFKQCLRADEVTNGIADLEVQVRRLHLSVGELEARRTVLEHNPPLSFLEPLRFSGLEPDEPRSEFGWQIGEMCSPLVGAIVKDRLMILP
jgi:hypothetical protein